MVASKLMISCNSLWHKDNQNLQECKQHSSFRPFYPINATSNKSGPKTAIHISIKMSAHLCTDIFIDYK